MSVDAARIEVEQACRNVVLRAAALTDARNHEAFAALFTPDGTLIRPGAAPLQGQAAIIAAYRDRPSDRLTRHLVCNTLFDEVSQDAAAAISSVLLWVGLASDAEGVYGRPVHRQVMGEFADHFALTPQGWRIARRAARFLLVSETG